MNIGLSLDENYSERLLAQAGVEGISVEEYARMLLIRALDSTQKLDCATENNNITLSKIQEEMSALRLLLTQVNRSINGELIKDIENFRSDFSVAVLVLLMGAGRVNSEEAKQWVKTNLRPKP